MKIIYVDTSVFGGLFDSEFSKWTERFFEKAISEGCIILYSDVTERELEYAPDSVIEFFSTIPSSNLQRLELDAEAKTLGEQYISESVVGASSLADCYHIALATVFKADLLVSWNFKHIVNLKRIYGYNSVNLKNGYRTLEIRTPREAFDYEND